MFFLELKTFFVLETLGNLDSSNDLRILFNVLTQCSHTSNSNMAFAEMVGNSWFYFVLTLSLAGIQLGFS